MPLTTYVAGEVLTAASLNNNFTFAAGSSAFVQAVSAVKTNTFSASVAQAAFAVITDLEVAITPTSVTNKVFVILQVTGGQTTAGDPSYYTLFRGATAIGIGDAAGNRQRTSSGTLGDAGNPAAISLTNTVIAFLDSPATTSATTYSVKVSHGGATQTVFVNRSQNDADTNNIARGMSSITAFEVTP